MEIRDVLQKGLQDASTVDHPREELQSGDFGSAWSLLDPFRHGFLLDLAFQVLLPPRSVRCWSGTPRSAVCVSVAPARWWSLIDLALVLQFPLEAGIPKTVASSFSCTHATTTGCGQTRPLLLKEQLRSSPASPRVRTSLPPAKRSSVFAPTRCASSLLGQCQPEPRVVAPGSLGTGIANKNRHSTMRYSWTSLRC